MKDEVENLLPVFGEAVRQWSAAQPGAEPPAGWMPKADEVQTGRLKHAPPRAPSAPKVGHALACQSLTRPRRGAGVRLVLAAAFACLLLSAVWLVRKGAEDRRREADARLLRQVEAQIARSVPAPLEPVMKLIAWEPGTSATSAE